MIVKLEGDALYGKHGFIGHVRHGVLIVASESGTAKVCAHGIMEFGGTFAYIWVNNTRNGEIYSISTEKARAQKCDNDDCHILDGKNMRELTEDDYRSQLLS